MQGLICHPWEVPRLLEGSLTTIVRPVVPQPDDSESILVCEQELGPYASLSLNNLLVGDRLAKLQERIDYVARRSKGAKYVLDVTMLCPFPAVGERFYVQEEGTLILAKDPPPLHSVHWVPVYRADCENDRYHHPDDLPGKLIKVPIGDWTPAGEMPERASRLKPTMVSVRVERISQCEHVTFPQWCADYPDFPWESNPYVWVGEVKV